MDLDRRGTIPDGRRADVTLILAVVLTVLIYSAWLSGAFGSAGDRTLVGDGAASTNVTTVAGGRSDADR